MIRPPNFMVSIQCLSCNRDFWHRVVLLADLHQAWANHDKCPDCSTGRKAARSAELKGKAVLKAAVPIAGATALQFAGVSERPSVVAKVLTTLSEIDGAPVGVS